MRHSQVSPDAEGTVEMRAIVERVARPTSTSHLLHALADFHLILSTGDAINVAPEIAFEFQADLALAFQLSQQVQSIGSDQQLQENTPQATSKIIECWQILWSTSPVGLLKKSVHRILPHMPWLLLAWKRWGADVDLAERIVTIIRLATKLRDTTVKKALLQAGLVPVIQQATAGLVPVIQQTTAEGSSLSQDNKQLLTSVWHLVKDLSFRGEPEEKMYLYSQLKDTLLMTSSGENTASGIVDALSAVAWNLATAEQVARDMAADERVWKALHAWNQHGKVASLSRNVSASLGTMVAACTVGVPPEALLHQDWLVPDLLRVLEQETDSDWRRRSMRTVRCFAGCEWGRKFLQSSCENSQKLWTTLLSVLNNEDDDTDTRSQVCQTMGSLMPFAGQEWCLMGPYVETALVQIVENPKASDKLVLAACQSLTISLQHSPWKRSSSCFSALYFERVYAALQAQVDQTAFHQGFSMMLLRLFHEWSPTIVMVHSAEPILNALSLILSSIGPDFEVSRKNAMAVIIILRKDPTNKRSLADHDNLLTALVNFCLNNEGPLKDAAKGVILELIPEL